VGKTETDDDGETKTWTYTYDYENRLIAVDVHEDEDDGESRAIMFSYDPFDLISPSGFDTAPPCRRDSICRIPFRGPKFAAAVHFPGVI
jgi:hypothetical protein